MNIQITPVSQLVPYAGNARTHSDQQVTQIAASISEFGFTNPILTGADNVIIAGHGRLLAAQKLGIDTVPVIVLDHLSEAQRRALVIADNKLAENAGWDEVLLRTELAALDEMDFDLDLMGFSDEELDNLLGDLDGSALGIAEVIENDHRNRVDPEFLRGQQATMPGDDDIVRTGQDRIGETELGDGRCNLCDLLIGMCPRIACIRHELRDLCHLDIHEHS